MTTNAASSIAATSATLNAKVTTNGLATSVWFQLGRTTSYGNASAKQSVGSGGGQIAVTQQVTGLGCGTYNYRAVASSSAGTVYGGNVAFLTAACAKGDMNGDGKVDSSDSLYLINALFAAGPSPVDPQRADVNGDRVVDTDDVFYLVNYLFAGGPPPA